MNEQSNSMWWSAFSSLWLPIVGEWMMWCYRSWLFTAWVFLSKVTREIRKVLLGIHYYEEVFDKEHQNFLRKMPCPPYFENVFCTQIFIIVLENFVGQLIQDGVTPHGYDNKSMAFKGEQVPSKSKDFILFSPFPSNEVHACHVKQKYQP